MSSNIGDQIISEAVNKYLQEIFPIHYKFNVTTHDFPGLKARQIYKDCELKFVGGTNLASSNLIKYSQWKLSLKDIMKLKDVTFMGVGWWQYQQNANYVTKKIYKRILNKQYLHSLRDNYTVQKFNSMGFQNVLNTGCPTTWEFTSQLVSAIPKQKAKSVVFTLTDYNKDIYYDTRIIETLKKNYEHIFFWPQGSEDISYIQNFKIDNLFILDPTLKSYDKFLKKNTLVDYVGTRLHAGIRAIANKKRSIIISIDNRAEEMKKDINLPVVSRNQIELLESRLIGNWPTEIFINESAIKRWKHQFLNRKK